MSNLTAIIQSVGGVTNHVAHEGFTRHTGTRPLVGTLNRSLASGEVLNVYDGSTLLGQAVVAGTHWAYSDRRSLSDGQTVSYSARLSGTSNPGPAYRFTVDTTPPPAPTIASVIDDVGAVQGEVARGGTTDDTRLRIRVGLSQAHQAGGKLMLFDGATTLGQEVVLEAQDIQRGWKEVHTPTLRAGAAYQLKAVVTDLAGNTAESGTHAVNIAATVRNAPRIAHVTDNFGKVQGNLLSGATTDDKFLDVRMDLTGTNAVAGDRFRLLSGDQLVAQGTLTAADIAAGLKMVAQGGLADGVTHALRAVVDPRIRVDNGVPVFANGPASDAFNITVETKAPVIVRVTDDFGAIKGAVVDGRVTDDRDLTVRVGLWQTDAVAGNTLRMFVRHDGVTTVSPTYTVTSGDLAVGFKDVALPTLSGSTGFELTARIEHPGFEGAESSPHRFTLDTVAPNSPADVVLLDDVGPVTGAVAANGRTDDQELLVRVALSGTNAVAGDSVVLMDGERRIAMARIETGDVQAQVKELATPRLLAGATYNLSARLVDVAGNFSASSSVTRFTVDTTAPNAPTIVEVIDDVGTVQGAVETVTDDTQLQVRVKVSGTNAVAGDRVELIDRTNVSAPVLMRSRVLTADDVNNAGHVDLSTTVLSGGTGPTGRQVVLMAQIVDAAGNRSTAATRTVTVDAVAPNAPSITSVTDDVGRVQGAVSGSNGQTDDLRPVVRVSLANTNVVAGDTLRLFNGHSALTEAVTLTATEVTNRWVDLTPSLVVNTTYRLNARITDRAGNQSAASAEHHFTTMATLAPAPSILSVEDDVGTIKGLVASGGVTDDTRLQLRIDLAGTGAVAGDHVEILNGTSVLGLALVNSVATPFSVSLDLQAGAYELSARVKDANQRVRTELSASHEFTIDTTAPAAPLALRVVDNFGPTRSLSLANGASTDDRELSVHLSLVTGTGAQAAKAGDTVILRDGSVVLATVTLTGADIAAGVREMVTPVLAVGRRHDLNAVVVDAAGNQGAQSVTHVINTVHRLIDAPSLISVRDDVGPSTGLLNGGARTDDAHLVLRVKLSETNAQVDDFVLLYNGADSLANFAPVKLMPWDIVAGHIDVETPLLADGSYSLSARIADNAGNATQASAAHAVTVDTSIWIARAAPSVTSVTDDVGTVQGLVQRTKSTDDTRPVVRVDLTGTRAQPDDLIVLYDDRTALDSGTRITSGDLWLGYKDVETPTLSDGVYPLRARILDRRGNLSAESMPHTIYVDTTVQPIERLAPTISSVSDDHGLVQGVVARNGVTDDSTLTVRLSIAGTNAVANDSIFVYNGANPTPFATGMNIVTVDDIRRGHMVFTLPGLGEGSHALSAVLVDNDGPRMSSRSAEYRVTVDRQAPGAPRISEVFDDQAGANLSPGALTEDRTPRVTVDLRQTQAVAGDTLILRSGTQPALLTVTLAQSDIDLGWKQVSTPALTNGQRYELNAVLADPAGNWSEASSSHAVVIQQAPPSILSVHDNRFGLRGPLPNGGLTNDATPTLRVSLADTSARAGDAVVVFDSAGVEIGSYSLTAAEAAAGVKEVSPTLAGNGTWGLRAAIRYGTGAAASVGALSAAHTVNLDTVASNAPVISDVVGGSSTSLAPGSRSDFDQLRVIVGFAGDASVKAGDVLTLRTGNTTLMTAALTAADIQAQFKVFSTPTLVHGNRYDLNAVLTDAAGNQSTASASHAVTINQLAPGVISVTDDQGLTKGAIAFAAWTDDARPTFRIGLQNTNAKVGDKIALYSGGAPISGAEFVLTATDLSASRRYKDVETLLTDGSRSISAAIIDQDGNRSRLSSAFSVRVDTVAPNVAPEIASVSAGGQTLAKDAYTAQKSLNVTVTLGTAAREGDTLTLRAGSTELISTVLTSADIGAGTRTIATPTLVDGMSYAFNGVLTDRAGNRGTAGGNYTVNIDDTPPNAPRIVSVTDDVGLLKGPLVSGSTTDDAQLVVQVSLDASNAVAGDTVRLFDGNTPVGNAVTLTATDIAAHAKDITTPALGAGRAYQLHAKVIDRAGNVGAASDAFAVTIDRSAPTVTAVNVYAKNGKPLNESQLRFGEEVIVEVVFDSDLVLRNANIALDQFSPSIRASLSPANLAGLPTLSINLGGQTASMSLVSMAETGSEAVTEKLIFSYTLPKNQTATDVIWVGENALSLNSYTLHDPAGNAANANHAWAGAGVKAAYGTPADDLFVVSRADLQALYAGAADDPLVRIDGKGGIDTLRLVEGGMVLDLTQVAEKRLQGIERIDMTTPTSPTPVADELRVTAADVLDMSRQNVWNVDGNANIADAVSQLMVTGNATDRVYLSVTGEGGGEPVNSGWTRRATNFQHEGVDYQVWNSVEENAQVLVRLNMQVFTGG